MRGAGQPEPMAHAGARRPGRARLHDDFERRVAQAERACKREPGARRVPQPFKKNPSQGGVRRLLPSARWTQAVGTQAEHQPSALTFLPGKMEQGPHCASGPPW